MNTIDLPGDTRLAGKVIEARAAAETQKQELGFLGRVFGGKNGPANIASIVVVVGLLAFLFELIAGNDTQSLSRRDAIAAALALISLSLGYLFGRGSRT